MSRMVGVIWLAAALGAAGCGPSGRVPGTCSANADCASDAHCRAGACVASDAPVASLTANADQDYWTNYLLHFDGAGAVDPASGERVAEYRWSFGGPLAEACPPVVRSPPGPRLDVFFSCPGDWDVRLVVVDGRGFAGAPSIQHLTVRSPPAGVPWSGADVPPTAAPRLQMADTVVVDHRCALDAAGKYHCNLEDAAGRTSVVLGATATPAPEVGGALAYSWTCGAPEALRSVATPSLASPTTAAPELKVETAGPSISGDYVCIVTVTDERQQRVSGSQIVRVGNRPPVLAPAAPAVEAPHRLEAAGYVASAPLPAFTVSDPDGDPVQVTPFTTRDANAGSATTLEGGLLTVRVQRGSPLSLLGPGVARSLELSASDTNGGAASAAWAVVVTNRPPRWVPAGASFAVGHAFDGTSYVASAALGQWVDDDGDPVTLVPSGDAVCAVASVAIPSHEDQLLARADCAQPFSAAAGVSSILPLLAPHALAPVARDPWDQSVPGQAQVTVLDQRPSAAPAALMVPAGATVGACCGWEVDPDTRAKFCIASQTTYSAGTIARTGFGQVDPEGDPVLVTVTPRAPVPGVSNATAAVSPATALCKGGACAPIWFTMPKASGCGVDPPVAVVDVTVDDGTGPVAAGSFVLESY